MMLLGGLFGRGPASEAGGLADNEAAGRMSPITVGIVGATGAVGEEIMGCLKERGVPVSSIELFASARSAGKEIDTPFGKKKLQEFDLAAARKLDVVFLAVSGDFARSSGPRRSRRATTAALVIDNSSAFRYDARYPLVVPEINAEQGRSQKKGGPRARIANPNCTTAIAVMALWPLLKKYGLKRCIMSTYQAASGAGAPGMGELEDGVKAFTAGKEIKNEVFAHPLPFNVIPHIDKFQDNGYTKEEMKVTWECRKIMSQPNLAVSCTAVRIPTLRAHAEAITVETKRKVSPEDARAAQGRAGRAARRHAERQLVSDAADGDEELRRRGRPRAPLRGLRRLRPRPLRVRRPAAARRRAQRGAHRRERARAAQARDGVRHAQWPVGRPLAI